MKSMKAIVKKSFEENLEEDMCNFNNTQSSDNSDIVPKKNCTPNKSRNGSKDKEKGSGSKGKNKRLATNNSRVSTKESHSLNISNGNLSMDAKVDPSGVLALVESLKDKLNIYEGEIRNLIEEKVQMQLTINSLQLAQYNSTKKSKKDNSNSQHSMHSPVHNSLIKSSESAVELNKHYIQEASGLKRELKNLDNNIQRQKNLLDQNYSILEETCDNITSGFNSNSNYLISINNSNKNTSDVLTAIYEPGSNLKGKVNHTTNNSINLNEIAYVIKIFFII